MLIIHYSFKTKTISMSLEIEKEKVKPIKVFYLFDFKYIIFSIIVLKTIFNEKVFNMFIYFLKSCLSILKSVGFKIH